MSGDYDRERRAARARVWFGVTLAIAVLWSLGSLIGSGAMWSNFGAGLYAEAIGRIAGTATFVVLICFMALYGIALRNIGEPSPVARYLAILTITVVAADGIGVGTALYFLDRHARSGDVQFARLAAEIDDVLAAEANAGGKSFDITIHTTGDAAVLEKIIKDYALRLREASQTYRGTMKTLDYPRFIEPERLGQKGGLADATKRIAQLHAAFDTLHKSVLGEQDGLHRALAAAAVPDSLKTPMLGQFDRRVAADRPKLDAVFADQDALFDEVAAMVADLRHSKARWTAKGRHMQFYDQSDLDRYNAHATRLRALEAKIAKERHALRPAHG